MNQTGRPIRTTAYFVCMQDAPRCSASAGRAGRGTPRCTVSRPARARRATTQDGRREALPVLARCRTRRGAKAEGRSSFQSDARAAGCRWKTRPSDVTHSEVEATARYAPVVRDSVHESAVRIVRVIPPHSLVRHPRCKCSSSLRLWKGANPHTVLHHRLYSRFRVASFTPSREPPQAGSRPHPM